MKDMVFLGLAGLLLRISLKIPPSLKAALPALGKASPSLPIYSNKLNLFYFAPLFEL